MKKYIVCSFCGIIVLTAAYIFSFQKLSQSSESISESEEHVAVVSAENTVKSSAKLIIETYNASEETADRKELTMPAMYLGLTRTGILEKLNAYMQNLSISDLEEGLISYDLMYYSPDYIMLRKTYQPDENFHKYYIKLSKGCITVFYSDKKTVYEYTDIDFNELPSNVVVNVLNGIEVKDEKALLDFLENYSS